MREIEGIMAVEYVRSDDGETYNKIVHRDTTDDDLSLLYWVKDGETDGGWVPGKLTDNVAKIEEAIGEGCVNKERYILTVVLPEARPSRTHRTGEGAMPKQCLCGCGQWTKGGMFYPGHDARVHGWLRRSAPATDSERWVPCEEAQTRIRQALNEGKLKKH